MSDDERKEWPETAAAVVASLGLGNTREAFLALRAALGYPAETLSSPERLAEALGLFRRVADEISPGPIVQRLEAAAGNPRSPEALYELGYQLIEIGLNDVAATVLTRADEIAPGQPAIVMELACALERDFRYGDAVRVLRGAGEALESEFLPRYLLAFNLAMTGDLPAAEELLPRLRALAGSDERQRFMVGTIEGFAARAKTLHGVAPLDARDARGWHFVLNGSVLLHLSPYGEDVMSGRYGWLQDDEGRCIEGIRRASLALEVLGVRPARVFALPDRESEILGRAAAIALRLRFASWPASGTAEPGLIVAYDLAAFLDRAWADATPQGPPPIVETLRAHRPGQVLWSHSCSWTDGSPIAPDLVTFQAQWNASPWAEHVRFKEEGGTERVPADGAPAAEIAARVGARAVERDAMFDVDRLESLCAAVRRLDGEHAAGALRASGMRRRLWEGGPVRANRFR